MKKTLFAVLCSTSLCFLLSAAASRQGYEPIPDAVDTIVNRLDHVYRTYNADILHLFFNELSQTEQRIILAWKKNPYNLLQLAAEARVAADEAYEKGNLETSEYNQKYADALERLAEMHAHERK